MDGLTMDYQLTIPAIMKHAEDLFGSREIVSRLPNKQFQRYTYADFLRRAKRFALALQRLGVQSGDRIATLCWNHSQHLEAYYAIPSVGGVLHTLNLRLSPDDLTYIVNHAEDKILLVDQSLLPIFEKFRERVHFQQVIVISFEDHAPQGMLDYEDLLSAEDESAFHYPEIDERQAAAMCYTSGTTGKPKGVLYTHRALALHSLASALPDVMDIHQTDTTLVIVPMFHANAWGLPFISTMVGAKQVFPGQFLDGKSLLECCEQERVNIAAGVPTIGLSILDALDKDPQHWHLAPSIRMIMGGSAAPEALIRRLDEYNIHIYHAWGMTESAPLGTFCRLSDEFADASIDEQYAVRALQGRPSPFIELRVHGENGLMPWDGTSMGELEMRGPWVASAYYNNAEGADRFTDDGWFKTGDVVSIDHRGYVKIQDRSKDVIKSGGEWISSIDLENALLNHPAVAEAAVIAIPDPKWQERPMAIVVLKDGKRVEERELIEFLAPSFAKWWLPDKVAFVEALPHTSTGKLQKSTLRAQFGR